MLYWFATITSMACMLVACASAPELTNAGSQVQTDAALDYSHCRHLGVVSGTAGGSVSVVDDDPMQSALVELRNNAASNGATHVVPRMGSTITRGTGVGRTSLMGDMYDCSGVRFDRAESPATEPLDGTETGRCYGNGTCNAGLSCASGLCVRLPTAPPKSEPTDEKDPGLAPNPYRD